MTTLIAQAVMHSTRDELARKAQDREPASRRVPYQVEVAESLLAPLAPRIRTRIWLALAKVAQAGGPPRQAVQGLGDGYRFVYEVDGDRRSVALLAVEHFPEAALA